MMTTDDVEAIRYFWREREDIERWSQWEERKPFIQASHPELIKAWDDYKLSIRMLNAVVRSLPDD